MSEPSCRHTPHDWALVVLGELVRDFRQNEEEGRAYSFATRLDTLDNETINRVLDELDAMVEREIQRPPSGKGAE